MTTRWRDKWLLSVGPYLAAATVLLLFRSTGLAQTIDLRIYDLITSQRPHESGRDSPITLIGIGESDIQQFGWPIDDSLFCKAFDKLNEKGVKAIGFDLYRDKGVGPNQQCLRDRFRNESNLVSIFNAASGIPAVPETPVERQAYNDLSLDADGVLRRDLVHVGGQDRATVSFPMRMLEVTTGDTSIRESIDAGSHRDIWLKANSGGYHNAINAGLGYQRLLQFREPGSYPVMSLAALLDGKIPEQLISNRIVLIGSTAPSLRDLYEVPHTRFNHGERFFRLTGLEIHANRLASLIDYHSGSLKHGWIMPGWGNLLVVLISGITGIILGEKITNQRISILVMTGLAGVVTSSFSILLWHQIWIGMAMPLAGLLSMGGTAWLRRGVVSQQHSEQIRRLLGQTTSPAVAQQLWEQRNTVLNEGRFQGQQLPITVLFTDTVSFTSVSERLPASALMQWLNRGMEICVPAITRRGGVVNKFTGDGMLAVFGVPLAGDPSADAEAAIQAAQEIKAGLDDLNIRLKAEGSPSMRMRIGIHSGEALVGSIGSAERMEYAVIGDAVNCASRLESLEKHRHTGILRVLLSGSTLQLLRPDFIQSLQLKKWGMIQVKGRAKALDISELRMNNEPSIAEAKLQ